MRSKHVRTVASVFGIAACVMVAAALVVKAPTARAFHEIPCDASGVCPTPASAFLSLDVAAGGANTAITVSGGSFLNNEPMAIDWDNNTGQVIGSATADGNGNFAGVHVKPFAGAAPGLHTICASVLPKPCAQFELQGPPSPTPSVLPSPSESPSPGESPTPTPSVAAVPASNNSSGGTLDVLLKPPFVFLPFLAAIALLVAIAFWIIGQRSARQPLHPATAISHRSVRGGIGRTEFDIPPPPVGPVEEVEHDEAESTPWPPLRPPVPDEPDPQAGDDAPPISES